MRENTQPGGTCEVEFRDLGPFEVMAGGRQLPIHGRKQKALLAMLVVNAGDVVSTDELIEALWGGEAPETGANALQVYGSTLRKILRGNGQPEGNDVLVTHKPGYLIDVVPDEIDARRFERLTAEGARALRAGRADEASLSLGEALSLWRGRALAEFAYEEFARGETARLEELKLTALEDRLEDGLALGRHGQGSGRLHRVNFQWPLSGRLRRPRVMA